MGRIRSRKTRARLYTPPPDVSQYDGHPKTPQRAGVLFAKLFSQELGIPIPRSIVRKITGVPERNQTRILSSKQIRTFHNRPDTGPDPRGPKRVLKRSDTAAIASYLDDDTVTLDDRGAPWQDVAEAAGVSLPLTTHFKPPGSRTMTPKAIQRACKKDEDLINAVCEEEKELDARQARIRLDFADKQLALRPRSYKWKDVVFCDEFHLGIGPQVTKHIKRRRGSIYREKACNVHKKKVTTKDTKAKAREEEHLKLLNVFIVIGYDYMRILPYEVPNRVGKMTTKVYTQYILPTIKNDLLDRGLTLCQDKDSAHDSSTTKAWFQKNNVSYITLPGNSPDLSIFESMAHPLKKLFHKRRTTEKTALAQMIRVFQEEIDQQMIRNMYKYYTKRLYDCKRRGGQMTKY